MSKMRITKSISRTFRNIITSYELWLILGSRSLCRPRMDKSHKRVRAAAIIACVECVIIRRRRRRPGNLRPPPRRRRNRSGQPPRSKKTIRSPLRRPRQWVHSSGPATIRLVPLRPIICMLPSVFQPKYGFYWPKYSLSVIIKSIVYAHVLLFPSTSQTTSQNAFIP